MFKFFDRWITERYQKKLHPQSAAYLQVGIKEHLKTHPQATQEEVDELNELISAELDRVRLLADESILEARIEGARRVALMTGAFSACLLLVSIQSGLVAFSPFTLIATLTAPAVAWYANIHVINGYYLKRISCATRTINLAYDRKISGRSASSTRYILAQQDLMLASENQPLEMEDEYKYPTSDAHHGPRELEIIVEPQPSPIGVVLR